MQIGGRICSLLSSCFKNDNDRTRVEQSTKSDSSTDRIKKYFPDSPHVVVEESEDGSTTQSSVVGGGSKNFRTSPDSKNLKPIPGERCVLLPSSENKPGYNSIGLDNDEKDERFKKPDGRDWSLSPSPRNVEVSPSSSSKPITDDSSNQSNVFHDSSKLDSIEQKAIEGGIESVKYSNEVYNGKSEE